MKGMSDCDSKNKVKVLFLCRRNRARSQMAEGIANSLYGDSIEAKSAGSHPGDKVSELAVEVMKEIGVDISDSRPKSIDAFKNEFFDLVVTVCDEAKEECPYFPNAKRIIHRGFTDPEEKGDINEFRKIRDEIKKFIEGELLAMCEKISSL